MDLRCVCRKGADEMDVANKDTTLKQQRKISKNDNKVKNQIQIECTTKINGLTLN